MDFENTVVTGKKPVPSGEGEPCARVVCVLLSWQLGLPWPGGWRL